MGPEEDRHISDETDALIFFADIIDSSKHSTVLGIQEYAQRILAFQALFQELSEIYFPTKRTSTSFCKSRLRGDEGTIFCVEDPEESANLVYKAVQFAFELKASIRLMKKDAPNPAPRPMDIGAGIHFGKVASVSCLEQPTIGRPVSVICDIEGFAINYAKRVESSSRMGKFSKIFLSREAARLLDGDPVVLSQLTVPIKGIYDSETVFEVNSALFDDMPRNVKGKDYETFVTKYCDKIKNIDVTRDPWMKGLIISTINSRMKATFIPDSLRSKYAAKVSEFIWQDIAEDDPIILFARARACGAEQKHTQNLGYLKALVDKYPAFVEARKRLAEVCWQISERDSERAELIIARDTIEEFINRFPQYLSPEEKSHFLLIKDRISQK